MSARRPPRLLVKTLAVTFSMVAALLVLVFLVVYVTVREQVRQVVTANLESSQRLVSAVETRRQGELRAQAENLVENPTLKAALDTYAAEAPGGDSAVRGQLLTMIDIELGKVAARFDSDAIVLVDARGLTIASAGRLADRWPVGRRVAFTGESEADTPQLDGVVQASAATFRLVAVPLVLEDATGIGTLYLATSLDQRYAQALKDLSRADTVIVSDGLVLASTLPPQSAREFEAAIAKANPGYGTVDIDAESVAFRRLARVGTTSLYALASIDDASRAAMRESVRTLVWIGLGAVVLALAGSFTLAHRFTEPIGQLSGALEQMAASHDVRARLRPSGSSREIDALTERFNALMASVATAEAHTQAAYTGAIRALAAALDARDPYTAGHSERVSVLSVSIARALNLSADDIEVIRLGALLHDIGKIGISDEILRKPGPLTPEEYDAIKQHPTVGARILRSVPFLSRHIPIVELHHERPDGRGYPHGLRGDSTPLPARVVHVADAYDAMTSARAYRAARPPNDALQELWQCAGTEFDAEIVGALATALVALSVAEAPALEAAFA